MSQHDWAFLLKYCSWGLAIVLLLYLQDLTVRRREEMYKVLGKLPWQSKEWRML